MSEEAPNYARNVSDFRIRILARIMIVVGSLTLLGVFVAQRHLSDIANRELEESIEAQIRVSEVTRKVRQAVLSEICDNLARQPRIIASFEDDALDLLYHSARNELRQIYKPQERIVGSGNDSSRLRSKFYRFLNLSGTIIDPMSSDSAGIISEETIAQLRFDGIPRSAEFGYLRTKTEEEDEELMEFIAVPIVSSEFQETIAALVVGFPMEPFNPEFTGDALRAGLFLEDSLIMEGIDEETSLALMEELPLLLASEAESPPELTLEVDNAPHRIVMRPLNPESKFPIAYEVFIASMVELTEKQSAARAQILTVAGILALFGLFLSDAMAKRLAKPVKELAEASDEEHSQRLRAEQALDLTSQELERAARFSADASHQLKTPVTVMRAGLQSILEDESLSDTLKEETRDLIRQTGRLSAVIDDLLLLSRLDAGHLQLNLKPTNLRLIIEELFDDLSILPDAEHLSSSVDIDPEIEVEADRGYTVLVLQNLIENARKYNRQGGRIQVIATIEGEYVSCRIGNTGKEIPDEAQSRIFERFHRGASGENVTGYGLGLNLARQLALLHKGTLELLYSKNDWTEFEFKLRLTQTD